MLPAILVIVFGLMGAVGAGGCAHAEFDIVRPPDLARHVGARDFVPVPVDPIEYRMIAYEDHLVIQAHNRSDEPIQLLADQSTVVDPNGQSHPLAARNQTILPGSFAKLVLPPVRTQVVPTGPTIGIGFGTVIGSGRRYRHGYYRSAFAYGYDPYFYDYPRYYTVYGGDDANLFWGWPDGGEVRLVVFYLRNPMAERPPPLPGGPGGPATRPADAGPAPGGARPPPPTFSHEFVFVKKKV